MGSGCIVRKPILITRNLLAASAADRWEKQYPRTLDNIKYSSDKVHILGQLYDLGKQPTPEQVDEIIGNSTWTKESCDQCGDEIGPWVQLGEELDYDSQTAVICVHCLMIAVDLCREA